MRKMIFSVILAAAVIFPATGYCQREHRQLRKQHKSAHSNDLIVVMKDRGWRHNADAPAINGAIVVKSLRSIRAHHLRVNKGENVALKIAALNADSAVAYVERDQDLELFDTIPNDPMFGNQWALRNLGYTVPGNGIIGSDINAIKAWDYSHGGTSIVVAVIDTGVDYTNPDLASNTWVNIGEIPANGIDDDGNGYVDDVYGYDFANDDSNPIDDVVGHGTHVAGIIGACGNNSYGVCGANWNVKIMALKISDNAGAISLSSALSAIEYAWRNGARISNCSWGSYQYSQALVDAIQLAGSNNHLFACAAGNDGINNDNTNRSYPSSYALSNIISVAASDNRDDIAEFSNYGLTNVHLFAPGQNILSTLPMNGSESGRYNGYASGTSMSTPYVAGAAAMILSVTNNISYSAIKSYILNNVTVCTNLVGKASTGGRLNLGNIMASIGTTNIVNNGGTTTTPITATTYIGNVWNFDVEANSDLIPTFQREFARGETWNICPRVRDDNVSRQWPTNTVFTFFWQKPNMGTNWWASTNVTFPVYNSYGIDYGRVAALWNGTTMDVGAGQYNWFIRGSSDGGISYRVNGTISMKGSPGNGSTFTGDPVIWPWVSVIALNAEATTRSNADVSINARIDALVVGAGLSTQDVLNVIAGAIPTSSVAYAVSAGTATTALGVAWSGVTGKPTVWAGTATDDVARASAVVAQATADAAGTTTATHTAQIAEFTTHAAAQTNVNVGVASGLSGLTTSVQTAQSTADAANSTGATHTAQLAVLDTFRTGSTVHYSTNSGNAATVGGLTAEEIMRVGLRYYFTTNLISYGAVTGRSCSLSVPTNTQIAVYTGHVTNGQYIATYLMKSNEMPAIFLKGIYSFEFNGYHTGSGKHPRIGADVYIVIASNGVVVQEFENTNGVELAYSADQIPKPFVIQVNVTNDLPKDGYAIVLKTKMIDNDGYNGDLYSYFGRNYWSGFITPVLASQFPTHDEVEGLIEESTAVVQSGLDTHTNLNLVSGAHGGMPTAAQVGAVATTGNVTRTGTLGGSNAVNQTDYPTLAQVQALTSSKEIFYLTTNITTAVTNFVGDGTIVCLLSMTNPPTTVTRSVTYSGLNSYPIGWVYTNQIFSGTYAGGLSHITVWCREAGAGSASHKPEFYFISVSGSNKYEYVETELSKVVPAGATYVQQDWDVVSTTTNLPEPCYGAIRLKVTAISGTPVVDFQTGNGTVSHLEIDVPMSVQLQPVYDLINTKADATPVGIAAAGGLTNNGVRINGTGLINGTDLTITGGGGVTEPTVTNIVLEVGAAQGWSTNVAYTWQGAQVVAAPTNLYTITYTAPATWAHNQHELLPYSTTNYGGAVTGVVTITMASNIYLASISGTRYDATPGGISQALPIGWMMAYESATSAVLSAWCSQNPIDASAKYYAYFSNLVVYTYDRTYMQPLQYTNDAAGIVARVDSLPAGNTDSRRVVNAESLSSAIAEAKPDIAKEAWRYTPSGARQPSAQSCTIDLPLVQQGQMAYLQSGNYYAMSYQGGDWYNTSTGSAWRLGPGGRVALEVTSTNRMLFIQSFTVATNWATIDIATNWITGAPYVEFSATLDSPQWLACPSQIVTSNSTYWRVQCPASATQRFYRAVSPGGANAINSYYRHNFPEGITVRGVSLDSVVTPSAASNIAQTVVAASHDPTYWITNTIVVSNSLDYAIPIAGNNVRVRWMAMFLSATNEAATSKRASFAMFNRADRLCDSAIYADTNQLYWAAPSTSAQAAGATTGTVADASGVVLMDRYAVGNGARFDFLTATQATATVISWGCTNKYVTTATANTKISHANYLTPVFYDDDSGQSNAWCRFAWTTAYTGTVTTIMRYSK